MAQTAASDRTAFVPEATAPPPGAGAPMRAFADAFATGAGSALTTRLSRSITVAVASVEPLPPGALVAQLPLPWVVLRLPYARGLAGGHALVLPLAGATALAGAALGEAAGGTTALTTAAEDALKQAATEMLTAVEGTVGPALERHVSFGPVTLSLVEAADAVPAELAREPGWAIRLTATDGEALQVPMTLTAAEALAQEIAAAAPAGASGGGEAGRFDGASARLDLILDISLPITVELGRARMQIQDILKLGPGSVIELEKSAGDPVELFINDRPIAKGEVVVIDENFGIRLTSIVTASERIRTLR
jgi:flagellar motor switch protein FliN/FliY